jgi:PKD repeat protein
MCGAATNFDRQVYMNPSGTLSFGTTGTARNIATSSQGFNNGKWHHVVATQSSAGMKLYVDGALVAANAGSAGGSYAGYWRVGGGASWSAPGGYFAGSIDEVAVYPIVLGPAQIAAHYAASVLVHPIVDIAPTASFTSSSSGLTLSVDGAASTDSDGLLAAYAWDFGDGSTGTGVTTAHTYTAPGTYAVTLTATDNSGAPGTFAASVTVDTAVLLAQDDFDRTNPSGWSNADRGGAWTVSPTSSWTVTSGTGQLAALTPGSSASASLAGVYSTNTDTALTLSLTQPATGSGTTVNVVGRRINGVGSYRAQVHFLADGTVAVSLVSTNGAGAETVITPATTVADLVYAPGDQMRVRLRVSTSGGQSDLTAKVWSATTDEPDTWLVSGSDTTAELQTPGGIGLNVYLSGSSDATSPVISFSGLRVFDATTI